MKTTPNPTLCLLSLVSAKARLKILRKTRKLNIWYQNQVFLVPPVHSFQNLWAFLDFRLVWVISIKFAFQDSHKMRHEWSIYSLRHFLVDYLLGIFVKLLVEIFLLSVINTFIFFKTIFESNFYFSIWIFYFYIEQV